LRPDCNFCAMTANPLVKTKLPTMHGDFDMWAFASEWEEMPHVVLSTKNLDTTKPVIVRIHSECMTGDVFGSKRCDCGEQLNKALDYIAANQGVLVYLRQEGRGIGILKKMEAYNRQDEGMDTVEANHALGFQADERLYQAAIDILGSLQIQSVVLISNNPAKAHALQNAGIDVIDLIHLKSTVYPENQNYLATKVAKMGHIIKD
jgi:3,4-dihydroxy 2-butanone 4-phosphate synthase / GTP cyclohydrolase II